VVRLPTRAMRPQQFLNFETQCGIFPQGCAHLTNPEEIAAGQLDLSILQMFK